MRNSLKVCWMMFVWLAAGSCLSAAQPTTDSLKVVKENILNKKAVLLDVREQDEWNAGHLEQAQHLPLSKIESGISNEELTKLAPKDAIVYLHCAAGVRSAQAAELLQKHQRDFRALQPGYQDLLKAGFPKAKK